MSEDHGRAQPLSATDDATPAFTRVKTRRGFEYIFDQIRGAIADGRYRPGDRLPAERDMAQIFGVSRQGVREAIRGLETTGLVETRPGVTGGVYVRSGDPEVVSRALSDLASLGALSADSLLEARVLLTSTVLQLACERATEEDLRRLEEDIEFTEQSAESEAGLERTTQITGFYRLLASATHNEVLVLLTDSLTQIVHSRLNRAGPPPDPSIGAIRRRILERVRAGDPVAATAELTAHLQRLESTLRRAEEAAEAGTQSAPAVR